MPRRICQPCGKKLPADAHPSRKYHEGCRPAKGGTVRALRAVAPGEKPDKPEPKKPKLTLEQAVESGAPYVEILDAQLREMVRDVKGEKGPARAAMYRQIALLTKERDALRAEAAQQEDEDAEVEDEAFDPAEAL